MPVNAVAENVLGTVGTICWTVQIVPQIWKSWRTKSTEGLSHWLVLIWGIAGSFLGAYAILLELNIPLIVQPQLFAFLAYISWGQCQYYNYLNAEPEARAHTHTRAYILRRATLLSLLMMSLGGALQCLLVFAVRPAYIAGSSGATRAVQFMGITSSLLIALALVPQYVEIYRLRAVIGISLLFMLVDMLGGVFSVLSLVFRRKWDVIAGVTYSLVVVLDGVIVVAALVLNPRRRREGARGVEVGGPIEARTMAMAMEGPTSME
ncbi:hypothetical protein MKEN_01115500 [Mycena kentingensis (nom. inval.)]|nr:hypothetical protein MKEN_01115500 [Mycena kentingensis (nom. inval.)]